MAITTDSTFTGQIEWEHEDSNAIRTIKDDGIVGSDVEFIDSGSGNLAVNTVWHETKTIESLYHKILDLSQLQVWGMGGNVYTGFNNIKAINLINVSGDMLYIGSSGVGSGIAIFGETHTIGYSGVAGWESACGYPITDNQYNFGIYNPNTIDATYSVSIVGNLRTASILGAFNDDFNDDFQTIIL